MNLWTFKYQTKEVHQSYQQLLQIQIHLMFLMVPSKKMENWKFLKVLQIQFQTLLIMEN